METTVTLAEQASTYYAIPVSQQLQALCNESLTHQSLDNLLDAHLSTNYGYFGSIDKTLAGMVVLSNAGDDVWAFDAREPDGNGQVWFQSHEDRQWCPVFDRLADYEAFVGERTKLQARQESDENFDACEAIQVLENAYKPERRQSKLSLATAELAQRYLWLVWQYEQPTHYRQEKDCGGSFSNLWDSPSDFERQYHQEKALLATDTQLAIFWLLHYVALADYTRVQEIIAMCADNNTLLFEHFATRLGAVQLGDNLEVLPYFSRRQSHCLLTSYIDQSQSYDALERAYLLDVAELAPTKAACLVNAAINERRTDDLKKAVASLPESYPSVGFIRCFFKELDDAGQARQTNLFVAEALASEDKGGYRLPLLRVYERATDFSAVLEVASHYLDADPNDDKLLAMAAWAAIRNGNNGDAFSGRSDAVAALAPLLSLAASSAKADHTAFLSKAEALSAEQRQLLCTSIVTHAEDYAVAASKQALIWVLDGRLSKPEETFRLAFQTLEQKDYRPLLDRLLKEYQVDGKHFSLLKVAFQGVAVFGFESGDIAKYLGRNLGAGVAKPEMFALTMQMLQQHEDSDSMWGSVAESVLGATVRGSITAHYTQDQCTTLIDAFVKIAKSQQGLWREAGRYLFDFNNALAEEVLLKHLDEPKNQNCEEIMSGLYAAIRRINTPRIRQTLVERLSTEKAHASSLRYAIEKGMSPELHALALKKITASKDYSAASLYMRAVSYIDFSADLQVDIVAMVAHWHPSNEQEQQQRLRIIVDGLPACVEKKAVELCKIVYPVAQSSFTDEGAEPCLLDAKTIKALDDIQSGKVDAAIAKLQIKLEKARSSNKPAKMNDKELGLLASSDVIHRMLLVPETGEVWFYDKSRKLHYFDGFELTAGAHNSKEYPMHSGYGRLLKPFAHVDEAWVYGKGKSRTFAMRCGHIVAYSQYELDKQFRNDFLITFDPVTWEFTDAAEAAAHMLRLQTFLVSKKYAQLDDLYDSGSLYFTWFKGGNREDVQFAKQQHKYSDVAAQIFFDVVLKKLKSSVDYYFVRMGFDKHVKKKA